MTLIFGFLIIAGFVLVMGARYLSKRQQEQMDGEGIRLSTEQLKAEMERSADAVISRLGSHVKHLEALVQEADEKNRQLESQLAQARRTEAELAQQSRQLTADLKEARRLSDELSAHSQVQLSAMLRRDAPLTATTGAVPQQSGERVDAQTFAAVLQQSMERDGQAREELQIPPVSVQQAAGLAEAMSNRPVLDESLAEERQQDSQTEDEDISGMDMSPNAAKARALLLSGYSVEETARETGIGKGAIELLREMNRHELEKK